jgi:hypothetical protein
LGMSRRAALFVSVYRLQRCIPVPPDGVLAGPKHMRMERLIATGVAYTDSRALAVGGTPTANSPRHLFRGHSDDSLIRPLIVKRAGVELYADEAIFHSFDSRHVLH